VKILGVETDGSGRRERGEPGQLGRLLQRNAELRDVFATDPSAAARLADLQKWQSQRLLRSHADLRANPRYRQAVEFFFNELYSGGDPRGRDRVLLSISLAPSRRALLTVTDPAWSALPGHGDTGSLTFDHPPALSMRATGTGTLLRLDLPPWSQVRALLKSAKVLRVTGRGHTALFHLLDMDAAITVLESCAATGKPSLSQVPFAPRP